MSIINFQPIMITGTVGATAALVLGLTKFVQYFTIHSPSNSGFLAATFDGVTVPIINGTGCGIAPLGGWTLDSVNPIGGVKIGNGYNYINGLYLIANASSTPYTILYL
jgi:hypothetical protein